MMNQELCDIGIALTKLDGGKPASRRATMEFHIHKALRKELGLENPLFTLTGNCILASFTQARVFAQKLNQRAEVSLYPERSVKAGQVNAMGLIDEILHYVCSLYRDKHGKDVFGKALTSLEKTLGKEKVDSLLLDFTASFPPTEVYKGKMSEAEYLKGQSEGVANRELALEELLLLLWLANDNPAFSPFQELFNDSALRESSVYLEAIDGLKEFFKTQPTFGPDNQSLVEMLKSPAIAVPFSLPGQLEYIRSRWGLILGKYLLRLLTSLDLVREEEKPFFPGPGPTRVLVYDGLEQEYERFSPDKDWMPRTLMIAKSTLVWLSQLSEKYNSQITRLDQIPDEELDILASRGFTALWLIGIWERSNASKRIKQICGNPEAAASAYSLMDYEIAGELGGWDALANLRERAWYRGIRLASDMVPNHTGMDSSWVNQRPDLFVQGRHCPFPGYTFNGENLSSDPSVGVFLEDHYYARTDAAVVFKRVDFRSGDTRYIYHGNDGTSMPWNDTAQIDFLNPEARKAVMEKILHVAQNFPIIRFDAAMVLAKKHIRRLWYPEPGSGGDIASRAEHAMSRDDFEKAMPAEFWREVVDLCAKEAPDTLLLAEAFWMLEGYFVRTLGMHRVYNSAFMNMLKREENAKYRSTIKNTQEFDPEILKRFVNFLNNPDEDTAVAQFGRGDKYFGVTTMMITMPGLPMFGHGQVEGFEEKYGMEYRKAYWKEVPDQELVWRHEREIFPIMKKRYLFSGVENFLLYDLFDGSGGVNENVFAFSNRVGKEGALVLFNNAYAQASGWIRVSAARAEKDAKGDKKLTQRALGDGLGLVPEQSHFTLLREQRSNLWYIRESKEIWEKGMFVMLGGYQCQVFLDIRDVADNELGQYRKLFEHLNGSGVRDIQAAIQDIFLKDLYQALYKLISPEYFASFRELSQKAFTQAGAESKKASSAPSIKTFIEGLAEDSADFYHTAVRFMAGTAEYGAFDAIPNSGSKTEAEAISAYSVLLANWFKTASALAVAVPEKTPDDLEPWLFNRLATDSSYLDFAAVLVFFMELRCVIGADASGADTCRLIDHWCLDRKMIEALCSRGCPEDKARSAMGYIKVALSRLDLKEYADAKTPADLSRAAFDSLAADETVRRMIGVNVFDGKIWYQKEPLEDIFWFFSLAQCLRIPRQAKPEDAGIKAATDAAVKKRLEEVAAVARVVVEAQKASEYQLDKLGASLSPAGKKKIGLKKTDTVSVDAKKAEPKKAPAKKKTD